MKSPSSIQNLNEHGGAAQVKRKQDYRFFIAFTAGGDLWGLTVSRWMEWQTLQLFCCCNTRLHILFPLYFHCICLSQPVAPRNHTLSVISLEKYQGGTAMYAAHVCIFLYSDASHRHTYWLLIHGQTVALVKYLYAGSCLLQFFAVALASFSNCV